MLVARPVWLFAMPWTGALQAPPPMEVSRQELWSGLPFPSPGALPYPGNPGLLIAGRIFILWATRKYEDKKYISLELPVFLQALFSEFLSTFRCQRIEDSPLFLRGDGGRNVGQLILKSVWRVHSLRNEEVDKNCRNWGCFVWKREKYGSGGWGEELTSKNRLMGKSEVCWKPLHSLGKHLKRPALEGLTVGFPWWRERLNLFS